MQPPVVILVGPQHPGNVGASARGAANFGCRDFRVVEPKCDIRCNEALSRALHAKPLLEGARTYATLKEALEGTSLSIGTTARTAKAVNHFLRKPSDIRDALEPLRAFDGTVAWVFGREDAGLTGAEVDLLDQLVTIPTAEYWSLNLSHAVTLCLYEHFRLQSERITPQRILEPDALQALHNAWDALVEETEAREWRQRTARGVWRKVLGRSNPDTFEVHNIMGIFANTLKRFGHPGYQTPASQRRLAEQGKLVPRREPPHPEEGPDALFDGEGEPGT
ncbi:MAG TPA: RNA methyltransferase [Candidatus Thermoplasmatota archaeon]|nr:RNA methyltransferase [Candidatus Thermoplasmatota archaeon]